MRVQEKQRWRGKHHDCNVQVWAESVPAAPERKGCAAVLEKDVQQRQPEGICETADAQSIQPQQTVHQQSQEALGEAGEGATDAVAPHPLLSVASPSRQTPEPSGSDASASAHPLMQVIACSALSGCMTVLRALSGKASAKPYSNLRTHKITGCSSTSCQQAAFACRLIGFIECVLACLQCACWW